MQKKNKMIQNMYNGSKIIGLGLNRLVEFFFFSEMTINTYQFIWTFDATNGGPHILRRWVLSSIFLVDGWVFLSSLVFAIMPYM